MSGKDGTLRGRGFTRGTTTSAADIGTSVHWWTSQGQAVLPIVFMVVFGLVPLLMLFVWSFWERDGYWIAPAFTLENYRDIVATGRTETIVRTVRIAAVTTVLAAFLAFPASYFFARVAGPRAKSVLLFAFTIPFIVSPLIRVFALRFLLGAKGALNQGLLALGVVDQPVAWFLFSDFAVYVGMLVSYLSFCIFPIWLAMERIDSSLFEASTDLGASPWQTLRIVVIPLALPGIFAGCLFVFVSVLGEMAVSLILGGAGMVLLGNMLLNVIDTVQYTLAAAISAAVLATMVLMLIVGQVLFRISDLFEPLRR